ncbi:MAG: hypothetical protein LBL67_02040 [Coriobacteriales bacterium]|jgi:hypothetical protein|nr:hypothetical protein [Coriobacteriales bacterium]
MEKRDSTNQISNRLFDGRQIRTVWDAEAGEYYVSIVDAVAVLTDNDYQGAANIGKS